MVHFLLFITIISQLRSMGKSCLKEVLQYFIPIYTVWTLKMEHIILLSLENGIQMYKCVIQHEVTLKEEGCFQAWMASIGEVSGISFTVEKYPSRIKVREFWLVLTRIEHFMNVLSGQETCYLSMLTNAVCILLTLPNVKLYIQCNILFG